MNGVDVVKRLDVTEKAEDEFVVTEVVDARPQKGPAHRQAEEDDERLLACSSSRAGL